MNIKLNETACKAAICLIAAAALILGLMAFSSRGSARAHVIGRLPSPAEQAAVFFEAYRSGSYEALDGCIYGYETLGLSEEADSDYGRRMLECLRSELSYEFIGEPVINGNQSEIKVKLGYFSIPDSAPVLKELFNDELLETMKQSEGVDLNVHDEAYYNEIIQPSFEAAIDQLVAQRGSYTRSETITVKLVYDNGWKIVPDDSLKHILLGGLD